MAKTAPRSLGLWTGAPDRKKCALIGFNSNFIPENMDHLPRDPRLLLIDLTPMAGAAATSVLKRAYFHDWRDDALLHLHCPDDRVLGLGVPSGRTWIAPQSPDRLDALIEEFSPEVVLYRPVADAPALHTTAMRILGKSAAPYAIWLMDDWPARLEAVDLSLFGRMDKDLRTLLNRSSANFAISAKMAEAFKRRYGVRFEVARGGVTVADWPERSRGARLPVRVRYAGSLAPDMTKSSVVEIASVVSGLHAAGAQIVFEGRAMAHWLSAFGDEFAMLPGVDFSCSNMGENDYRKWLADADIVVAAYNFDEESRRYTQYSFANKTAELLASGAAILAYGPEDLETIASLKASGAAICVTERSARLLEREISRLVNDRDLRRALGANGRRCADIDHRLSDQKAALKGRLLKLAAGETGMTRLDANEPRASEILSRRAQLHPNSMTHRRLAAALTKRYPRFTRLLSTPVRLVRHATRANQSSR